MQPTECPKHRMPSQDIVQCQESCLMSAFKLHELSCSVSVNVNLDGGILSCSWIWFYRTDRINKEQEQFSWRLVNPQNALKRAVSCHKYLHKNPADLSGGSQYKMTAGCGHSDLSNNRFSIEINGHWASFRCQRLVLSSKERHCFPAAGSTQLPNLLLAKAEGYF